MIMKKWDFLPVRYNVFWKSSPHIADRFLVVQGTRRLLEFCLPATRLATGHEILETKNRCTKIESSEDMDQGGVKLLELRDTPARKNPKIFILPKLKRYLSIMTIFFINSAADKIWNHGAYGHAFESRTNFFFISQLKNISRSN